MNRNSVANLVALLAALTLALLVAWPRSDGAAAPARIVSSRLGPAARAVPLAGGGLGVPDASGHLVPLRPYQRISSASSRPTW